MERASVSETNTDSAPPWVFVGGFLQKRMSGSLLRTRQEAYAETDAVPYDDKTRHLFYNASAWAEAADPELRAVLRFIHDGTRDSDFSRMLGDSVAQAKVSPEKEDGYMYFTDIVEQERERARQEGHDDEQRQTATTMAEMGLPLEQIARALRITQEQAASLIA